MTRFPNFSRMTIQIARDPFLTDILQQVVQSAPTIFIRMSNWLCERCSVLVISEVFLMAFTWILNQLAVFALKGIFLTLNLKLFTFFTMLAEKLF